LCITTSLPLTIAVIHQQPKVAAVQRSRNV